MTYDPSQFNEIFDSMGLKSPNFREGSFRDNFENIFSQLIQKKLSPEELEKIKGSVSSNPSDIGRAISSVIGLGGKSQPQPQPQSQSQSQQQPSEDKSTSSSVSYQAPIKSDWKSSGNWYTGATESHPQGHKGIDMRAPIGTPIYPMANGKVSDVSVGSGKGGNTVSIEHPNGLTSYYAHLSTIKVKKNEEVDMNTVIGAVGMSGNAKGGWPHLHFGVRDTASREAWKDPAQFFSVPKYTDLSKEEKEKGIYLSEEAKREDEEFKSSGGKLATSSNNSLSLKYKKAEQYFSSLRK